MGVSWFIDLSTALFPAHRAVSQYLRRYLTPPFGWALFYLKGVTPPDVPITAIYKGVIPFIVMQGVALALVVYFPGLALWLPKAIGW
ncbi:MAG: TRAP transporter large permease subunit [Burkholderiaceae bacterium]|nr:TRAP transporter large permease subunit [Burkholderiaceae bacterium]MCD8517866.1 TRAP transporter large permease subunit [Burkholderiaceae bacterium]